MRGRRPWCRKAWFAALILPAGLMLASRPLAQEPEASPAAEVSYEEVQALVTRMQQKVQAMSQAAAQRDEALKFLEDQIEKATGRISGSEETKEALRQRAAALNVEVEDLSVAVDERRTLVEQLEQQVASLTEMLSGERDQRAAIEATLGSREETLASLTQEREQLRGEVGDLERRLEAGRNEKQALDEQLLALRQELESQANEARSRIETSEARVAESNTRIAELRKAVEEKEIALGVESERVRTLTRQLVQINTQLSSVESLLQNSETTIQSQQGTIAQLGQKLNQALAAQVEELSEYRSEFFGRLKAALGDRRDIQIVGDRFVFQADVFFDSGSAQLEPEGEEQLRHLAQTLKEVADRIPPEIDWILRVDGHTDKLPLRTTSPYASNWELSTARAISVVEFLIDAGVPADRLAATGFGEYQPREGGDSEIAYRRNRRIEFKLTSG